MSPTLAAPPRTPQTPQTPAAQTLAPADAPNGAWRHPQFDEIARRRYATTFDHQNVHTIVSNAALLLLSIYGNHVTAHVTPLEYAACVLPPGLSPSAPTDMP